MSSVDKKCQSKVKVVTVLSLLNIKNTDVQSFRP